MNRYKNSGIFLFIAGGLLLIVSMFLLFFPREDYSINITIMSLSFVIIGLFYILAFVTNTKWHFRPGWTLSQGFYLIIMGILCLYSYDNEFSDSLNLIFALWALTTSTNQISSSIKLRSLEFCYWYRMLLAGFLNLLFCSMFVIEPFDSFLSVYTSFGIYIFVSGIICIIEPFNYKKTN